MLKITDQNASEVQENQLKTLKNKSTSPIKFIAPPKNIVEALQAANLHKYRQEQTIENLKSKIEAPGCLNKNSLNLQLEMMLDSRKKLHNMLCAIVQHLVTHKYPGIRLIARYIHQNQPNSANWYKVSLNNGHYIYLSISNKLIDLSSVAYHGKFLVENQVPPHGDESQFDLITCEAIKICEDYNQKLLIKHAQTKDINLRINVHNKVVKTLKLRIQQGLTKVIPNPEPAGKKKGLNSTPKVKDSFKPRFSAYRTTEQC